MAVPPLAAKIIFEAVLNCLADNDYPATVPNITPVYRSFEQKTKFSYQRTDNAYERLIQGSFT
jgi:hypothetical protein